MGGPLVSLKESPRRPDTDGDGPSDKCKDVKRFHGQSQFPENLIPLKPKGKAAPEKSAPRRNDGLYGPHIKGTGRTG